MQKGLRSVRNQDEIIEAVKNKTPEAEQWLVDIARDMGVEEVELFNGEVVKL